MATHVTKEPVTLDGYQAILKPSEYGHTLTALLPKEIVDALEDERVGGLEWAKSKAKNPRRVTIKPEPWEEVSEGMYQCKFRWKEGDKVFVKPPHARCTNPWTIGWITDVNSDLSVDINGVPRHASDVRCVPSPSEASPLGSV